jgi:hypothetical protein
MSDTTYTLLCFIEGDNTPFPVTTSSTVSIGGLKETIKEKNINLLQEVDA